MQYIRRHKAVKAAKFEYTPGGMDDVFRLAGERAELRFVYQDTGARLFVIPREGEELTVREGEYLILEEGEGFSACPAAEFEAAFEPVAPCLDGRAYLTRPAALRCREGGEDVCPGLPRCALVRDEDGRVCQIYRGESTLYPLEGSAWPVPFTDEDVAEINQRAGVTPAQLAAMVAGVRYGWRDPRADPAGYDRQGNWMEP